MKEEPNLQEMVETLRAFLITSDGLWFTKVEEKHGFEHALELDIEVWTTFATLASRKILEKLNISSRDAEAIARTVSVKWRAVGWEFQEVSTSEKEAVIRVTKCPWREAMVRAGREKLAPRICDEVCTKIYEAWAASINPRARVEKKKTKAFCEFVFSV